MNVDKQALRGLSVESPFYLAECCNCGEIMPSSKLRESRNYPDDDGECHCPHCNADDCDIADSGAVGSEAVTAWNYQQKRIEALLDELESDKEKIKTLESRNRRLEGIIDAAEKRIAEPSGQKRLIGWRASDYTDETSDPELAKNWAAAIGVLPIFEGDVNTKLSAAGIGVGE